jgi:hypothetical protein
VQDAQDLDRLVLCAIHQKVTPATAAARNVDGPKPAQDFVPRLRSDDIGSLGELRDRLQQGITISPGLSGAEILGRPFEDIGEIDLGGGAKPNTLCRLGHAADYFVGPAITLPARSSR